MVIIAFSAVHILPLAQEIATLRKEAQAFKRVRTALRSPDDEDGAAKLVFDKVCCCIEYARHDF